MIARFSFLFSLGLVATSLAKGYDNTVYLIRHGEKPSGDGQGLSAQGEERAQCLTSVFGLSSPFNIGYILAEKPQKNGDRTRPLETITPLAEELGLDPDTSCDRDDQDCVADAIKDFAKNSDSNILVCWEHSALQNILDALGVNKPPKYPSDSFDLIYTVQNKKLVSQASENCPGLDD